MSSGNNQSQPGWRASPLTPPPTIRLISSVQTPPEEALPPLAKVGTCGRSQSSSHRHSSDCLQLQHPNGGKSRKVWLEKSKPAADETRRGRRTAGQRDKVTFITVMTSLFFPSLNFSDVESSENEPTRFTINSSGRCSSSSSKRETLHLCSGFV